MVSSSSLTNQDGNSISTLHQDIILSHILTRLDGPTLASISCSSSELNSLSSENDLWKSLCSSKWPSVNDMRVQSIISTFPKRHRSFFSDSYSFVDSNEKNSCWKMDIATTELISCVDLEFQNVPVLSKVVEVETTTGWSLCSPFRVDLLDQKEYVETWVHKVGDDSLWMKQLEENLRLSWIVIDPKTKRSMNVSSLKPNLVKKHWLSNEVHIKFGTVLVGGGKRGTAAEFVACEVEVKCHGKEGGKMQVTDVSMWVEDMEGRNLNGKDGLAILRDAMEGGERKGRRGGEEGKERYEGFMEKKKERKENIEKREKVLDMSCIGVGISLFLSFWCYYYLCN